MRTPLRVGWCPGALRPMMAGDGLLVRVKPRGSRLTVEQAPALADLSERFGNGILNVTGRGNLQLRGIAEAGLPALSDALASLGLLDPTPEGEAVRNVVASPLAGHDPHALLDIRPIVAALEDRLLVDPALWRLPAKFSWLVDDGGQVGLGAIASDVRFTAVETDGGVAFAIGLGEAREALACCAPAALGPVAAALARAFGELCAEKAVVPHRMRDLVALSGDQVILTRAWEFAEGAQMRPLPAPEARHSVETRRVEVHAVRTLRRQAAPIGAHAAGAQSWIGVAPPFGRLEAARLERFTHEVAAAGAAEIRLTPWRSIVVPGLAEDAAQYLWNSVVQGQGTSHRGRSDGWIVDLADPRMSVAACAGAPACRRATTPVQFDAARLAPLLAASSGMRLHVSGCAKGCAHGGVAPLTLVGRDGSYDLVRDGKAGDAPERTNLSLESMVAMLQSSARIPA